MMKKNTSKEGKKKEKSEFDQKVLGLARVARVTSGGRRFRFRAVVVVGDRKGRVGVGIDKGKDVTIAVNKAVAKAKKGMIKINITKEGSIPYEVNNKYCSAKIFMKPAKEGSGVKAGGPVRAVVELAGIKNITSKMYGSANKYNNALATIEALKEFSK